MPLTRSNTLLLLLITVLLALLTIVALPAHAAAPLPDFTAHYSAYKGSFRMARARVSLEHTGNQYIYTSFTEPAGLLALFRSDTITERSTWIYHNDRIRPLEYHYVLKGGRSKDVRLDFRWDEHRVFNTVAGHTWHMSIPDDALDKFSVQLAVMLDLRAKRRPLDYDIADGGKLKHWSFTVLGNETVSTPAGVFDAVKLLRDRDPDNKRQTFMWCAPKLDYLLIKIEHIEKDGSRFHMSLDKVDGIR
jgi:hypothetical protein